MTRFHLSRSAKKDYKKILIDSMRQFGVFQQEHYRQLLDLAMEEVAANPMKPRTKARDDLGSGIRTYSIAKRGRNASHQLYFRVGQDGIVAILRILHIRMEVSRHFPHQ